MPLLGVGANAIVEMTPFGTSMAKCAFALLARKNDEKWGRHCEKYSLWGSNPRPMAHKTIALTTELREPLPARSKCKWLYVPIRSVPPSRDLCKLLYVPIRSVYVLHTSPLFS